MNNFCQWWLVGINKIVDSCNFCYKWPWSCVTTYVIWTLVYSFLIWNSSLPFLTELCLHLIYDLHQPKRVLRARPSVSKSLTRRGPGLPQRPFLYFFKSKRKVPIPDGPTQSTGSKQNTKCSTIQGWLWQTMLKIGLYDYMIALLGRDAPKWTNIIQIQMVLLIVKDTYGFTRIVLNYRLNSAPETT